MQVEFYWYFILCYIILSQLIMRLWSEFDKWSKIEILLSKHTSTYLFDPIIIHHLGTRRPAKLLHDGNRPLLKLFFKLYIPAITYDSLWTFKSWPFGLLSGMRQTDHNTVWWLNWLPQLGMTVPCSLFLEVRGLFSLPDSPRNIFYHSSSPRGPLQNSSRTSKTVIYMII